MTEVAWFDPPPGGSRRHSSKTEKPILFSTGMIRVILDGSKTQTRRMIRPQPVPIPEDAQDACGSGWWWSCSAVQSMVRMDDASLPHLSPYGSPGSTLPGRLWVRETWQAIHADVDPETGIANDYRHAKTIPLAQPPGDFWTIAYKADRSWAERRDDRGFPWRPGIHMPRRACRLVLDIKSIRAERVQDISVEDIIAEGFSTKLREHDAVCDLRDQFAAAWDKLNGKRPGGSWADNPWVWAITFEVSDAI